MGSLKLKIKFYNNWRLKMGYIILVVVIIVIIVIVGKGRSG